MTAPADPRALPRRPRGRMAAAGGHPAPAPRRTRCGRSTTRICCALPILYRGALSSLSVARETSLDLELVTYLEGLCARAYFFVYGVRTSAGSRLGAFFARDWPAGGAQPVARDPGRRSLLTLIGALAGYLLVDQRSRAGIDSFVPPELAGGRDFSASTEFLRDDALRHADGARRPQRLRDLPVHPQQPGLRSSASRWASPSACRPRCCSIYNGAMLGAMLALCSPRTGSASRWAAG